MNIAIIGAGAIGSVLGGLLARAGLEVTLIGRQPQVSAINQKGLALDGVLGSFIDYLNGEVVALGQRTGTPTPYNTAVVELVHQVEDQHQFVSVKHLVATLNERRPRLRLS